MNIERQSPYDGHILALCNAAAFNAWEVIENVGKKIASLTKVIQARKKPSLLQSLISYKDEYQQ